jgi:hypothetical protein
MNPEIIESQIRAFQSAKSLETMADFAWELALTLGETSPDIARDAVAHSSRAAWLCPILSMAHRDWARRTHKTFAGLLEVLHLAAVFDTPICLATEDARMVAEDALIDALLAIDESIIVALLEESFGRALDSASLINSMRVNQARFLWVRARRGSEILDGMPAHLRETGIFAWWRLISEHGKED